MEQLKEFVMKYFKIIVVVLSFSLTLYIQHVNNTKLQNWKPNVSVWKWKSRTSMTVSTP